MQKKEKGNLGFSKEYWDKNYSEPEEMDNICNAKEHVRYIQSLFYLEQISIHSIIDFGFGLGFLFDEAINTFRPQRVEAIEPSKFAFDQVKDRIEKPEHVKKFKLKNIDLLTWCKEINTTDKAFDFGICTSVFQYLTDDEVMEVLPILSRQVRYLYFSVPTDIEYERQIKEYDFFDEFSYHRKREKYLKWIKPYFTVVSSRLLESKHYFDDDNTQFREQLFRF